MQRDGGEVEEAFLVPTPSSPSLLYQHALTRVFQLCPARPLDGNTTRSSLDDEAIPLIVVFLERMTEIFDEIQRDVRTAFEYPMLMLYNI